MHGARLLLCLTTLGAVGCAARLRLPPAPAPRPSTDELAGVALHLRHFDVRGEGDFAKLEPTWLPDGLRELFADHLWAEAEYARIHTDAPWTRPARSAIVDAELTIAQARHSTVVLDVLMLPWFGLLAPHWGEIDASLSVAVRDAASGAVLDSFRLERHEDFSAFVFTLLRTNFVFDAQRRAVTGLFAAASARVANGLRAALAAGRLDVAAGPSAVGVAGAEAPAPSSSPAALVTADALSRAPAVASSPTGSGVPGPVPLAGLPPAAAVERGDEGGLPVRRSHSLFAPPRLTYTSRFWSTLALLGGVEVSPFYGFARVASQAKNESGARVDIAAGQATQTGYRVALYKAPARTGFFVYPTLGYMQQTIAIADFRETLPKVVLPGSRDIEAVCRRVKDYALVECGAPTVYDLDMKSGYGGGRGGLEFVFGDSGVQMFGSASLGLNLVEYRAIRAHIADHTGKRRGFDWLGSGAAGGTLGVSFPESHVALRFNVDYELYRNFKYAQPIDFRGPSTWDETVQNYVRPPTYVDGASLSSWSLQCALALTL